MILRNLSNDFSYTDADHCDITVRVDHDPGVWITTSDDGVDMDGPALDSFIAYLTEARQHID